MSLRIVCSSIAAVCAILIGISLHSLIPPSLTVTSREIIRDSIVVVTGASSGIGAETAIQYGALGARVVIGARRLKELEAVAVRIRAAGGEAIAVSGDMGDASDCASLIAAATTAWGGVDTLVVNHALFDEGLFVERNASSLETTLGAQLRVNVLGAAWLVSAALPWLEKSSRGGRIIEVSSGTTRIAAPFHPGYGASKSGAAGLFRHIAAELSLLHSNVSITSAVLGMIATPEILQHKGLADSAYPVPDTARGIIEAGAARVKVAFVPKWIAVGTWLAYLSPTLEHLFMNDFYTQRVPAYVAKLKEHSRAK
jgi:NAD(P)-dependent dehydrogenase (short-subunit alcohol dehydrogenase family)